MIKKNKTLLLMSSLLALSACSSVSNLFGSDEPEQKPLEGERISVLELQKTLAPDAKLEEGQTFTFPKIWENPAWPQAGGYPTHVMHNLALSDGALQRIWNVDIGAGSTDEIPLNAQPILANGKIFTLDIESQLSAFNAENGKRLWSVDLEKEDEDEEVISGGIAHGESFLYVTNGYDDLIALSPETGETLWQKRLPAPSRAAPSIFNGRVFVSTIDSRVLAFDAQDGTNLWEYIGIGETTGLLGAASPAVNNDIVVPAFSSGEITALRIENGSVAWSDNLASVRNFGGGLESLSDIRAMPVMDRGIVVAISFGGKLAAIDQRTGTRIWQREISGSQMPWISGNILYVLDSDNQLIALSLKNGAILWIQELQKFEDPADKEDPVHWSGPVMANGRLLLASSHGLLAEINASNGDIIRQTETGENVQIAPLVAGGTLYLLAEDGTLMAYR